MSEENKLLAEENQRLHDELGTVTAERDAARLLLEAEKKKMPVRFGRAFWAMVTAAFLLVGGYFSPLSTVEIMGSKFESTNLLQLAGIVILLGTFFGPLILAAITAYKSK
jgi:hypothetical protein